MDNKTIVFEKLNNKNYLTWSFKMKMLLIREELWDVIEGTIVENELEAETARKKQRALSMIVLLIENDQIVLVRNAVDGVEAWNILKNYHQKSTLSKRIRIFKMELAQGASMHDHLNQICELYSELAEMDAKLDDPMEVSIILASVNEDYENLITAMEAWEDSKLTLPTVKSKLLEEWEKKKDRETGMVLVARKVRKQDFNCYFCGKPGHCSAYKSKCFENGNKDFESAKMARFNQWYKDVSFSRDSLIYWCVDSGASSHMCGNIELFKILKNSDTKIELADGKKINSQGIGTVSVVMLFYLMDKLSR